MALSLFAAGMNVRAPKGAALLAARCPGRLTGRNRHDGAATRAGADVRARARRAEPGAFRRVMFRSVVVSMLVFAWGGAVRAQTPTSATPAAALPRVTHLQGHLELDYTIAVDIDHLAPWAAAHPNDSLVPFLNGRPIEGNYPVGVDLVHGRVMFHLKITKGSEDAWTDLLGAPEGLRRPVTFTVGPEHGSPFGSVYDRENPVLLTVISPVYGAIALALVLITLIIFIRLARTTSILRKPGVDPGSGKLRPYDLGHFQMAFWFFLIYASYTSIWLVTDATDTITPSLLVLMGISAGTALGEAMIDAGQTSPPDKRTAPTKSAAASPPVSNGFLRDLLSDANGYRFDRFQIFAFTMTLGMVFLSAVYNSLSMPEFSPTLLALMGLSSGTYIGFKLPERKPAHSTITEDAHEEPNDDQPRRT